MTDRIVVDRSTSRAAGLEAECTAGLAVERPLQRAAMRLPSPVVASNLFYSVTHLLVPFVLLVLLYRRARTPTDTGAGCSS